MAKKKVSSRNKRKRVSRPRKAKTRRTMTAKNAVKRKAAPKRPTANIRIANRRESKRYETSNLWVLERSGEHEFLAAAKDVSEGGIFLKQRLMTSDNPSVITLNLGKLGKIEVEAQPVYDRVSPSTYGTGYRFVKMSSEQLKSLRGYLRNLD